MTPSNFTRSPLVCVAALAIVAGSVLASLPSDQRRSPLPPRFDRAGDLLPDRAIARLGTNRFRHTSAVNHVAYSPDGKLIFSSAPGETGVQVWEAATGRPLRRIGTNRVWGFALSPDGKRLATGEDNQTLRVWEVATGQDLCSFGTKPQSENAGRIREELDAVQFVAFAGDSDRIVAAQTAERAVYVWDVPTKRSVVRISGGDDAPFVTFAVARDGRQLLAGAGNGEVSVWNLADGKPVRKFAGHTDHINGIALSNDGSIALTTSTDRTTRCWDVATGLEKWRQETTGFAGSPLIAPGGRSFALVEISGEVDTATVQIGSMVNGKVLRSHGDPYHGFVALAYSPDGATLAGGGAGNAIRLWSVASGKEVGPGPGHTGGVTTLVFSPDGRTVATCSVYDLAVRVWDSATGEQLRAFDDHPAGVDEVQFSPDGRWLATGAWDHPVFIWDVATGRCVQSLADHPSIGPHFRFAADGKSIVTAGRAGPVGVWDCASGKLLATHSAPTHEVASLLSFVDGKILAIERQDGEDEAETTAIALWELTTGRVVRRFNGHRGTVNCAILSRDGRSLASRGDDQTVRIWEIATGRERRSFRDAGESASWVGTQFLAFSGDGRTLASCGTHDPFPRLWDLAKGCELAPFKGHHAWIGAVEFSPDSRRLLTGSQDTTAITWDLSGRLGGPRARPLAPDQLAQHWESLLLPDSVAAFPAIWALIDAADSATAFLRQQLKPDGAAGRKQIALWIQQLDHPQFAVRERATASLSKAIDEAEEDLRRALPRASAEARERIRRILDGIHESHRSPERLRTIRALEVLEGQGTPAARELLADLGRGAPELLAREARESLRRLETRRPE